MQISKAVRLRNFITTGFPHWNSHRFECLILAFWRGRDTANLDPGLQIISSNTRNPESKR